MDPIVDELEGKRAENSKSPEPDPETERSEGMRSEEARAAEERTKCMGLAGALK